MKPRNIETSYGKFPTLTHFERYWEDKVSEAFRAGWEAGKKRGDKKGGSGDETTGHI